MSIPLVIVTGASRGIGAALVRRVPFPARVIGISRSGGPEACEVLRADLATPAGWRRAARLFDEALPEHADGDVFLWQNAGTLEPIGFAGEVDPDAYARSVLLGSAAPQVLGDAFLRAARASGAARARLIVIGSGAGRKPYEGWSSYCAGKAALDHWVRTVGREQERRGGRCRVLSIAPGVVATEMQERIRRSAERDFPELARFEELHESGALRDPDDAARGLWEVALREDLANGSVLDVRDLGGSR